MLSQQPFFVDRLAPRDCLVNLVAIDLIAVARENCLEGDTAHAGQHGARDQLVAFSEGLLLLFDLLDLCFQFS
jgi:hypothetical protein